MKSIKKLFQLAALMAFVAMALASYSAGTATIGGEQRGTNDRKQDNDKSLGVVTDEGIDSLATTPDFDYAYAE